MAVHSESIGSDQWYKIYSLYRVPLLYCRVSEADSDYGDFEARNKQLVWGELEEVQLLQGNKVI